MIRTMQLVAQLANKRSCVGFRSNFEKITESSELTIFSGIHCRHNLRMPFSGIRGFRQVRGESCLVHGR